MTQEQNLGLFYSEKQQIFVRYLSAILIDLVVLNLFDEYWDNVIVESFTISLLVAIFLQVLLKVTIKFEHRIAKWFDSKTFKFKKIIKIISLWAVLFVAKILILELLSLVFSDEMVFKGAWHGVIAFLVVVTVMILAEQLALKINKSLGDKQK